MPLSPAVINCATYACCPPPAAQAATVQILRELGCEEPEARKIASAMESERLVFAPRYLTDAIGRMVDHPGRRGKPEPTR